ncbi:unnamed protein product (macronuclear) [Paramecium tetraurelia]|uniref:Peptidase A1 domain-containing protein n=1 Tax=Paramecium tetraurelia TaxID=5888 RepID=A0DGX4_PARTE|nr:uncharacterized protein GSPATT00002420001 [Paramecium tetraurelia]CAK82291.1 unnamed protein product [Paramecium tetraurelia]|eukprot:XP_001449688.1 hypothetical protein (macronuclear) [Paramecium tetraurelia strain d4-2]
MITTFVLLILTIQAKHKLKSHPFSNNQIKLNRHTTIEQAPLDNYANIIYYINASFGTPEQVFSIVVDTGSVTTWISNQTCEGCIFPRFDPNKSTTLQQADEDHSINYNIGSLSGKFVQDYVSLTNGNLNVSMKFMLANVFTMPGIKFQGLLGLSSYNDRQNIFEYGYQQKLLETSMFGLNLNRNPQQSILLYNNFSQDYLDQVVWMPNVLNHQWSMKVYGFFINEIDLTDKVTLKNGTIALMDSGSSCLWLDEEIINYMLHRYILANCISSYSCPCNSPFYPNLNIYLAGVKIEITPEHYMIPSVGQYCKPCFSKAGQTTHDYTILGDPAMQAIISIYDKENQQFGVYQGNKLHKLLTFQIIQISMAIIQFVALCLFSYKFYLYKRI